MKWIEDTKSPFGKIVKLKVGESIEGALTCKYPSQQWNNRFIYKIKSFETNKISVILGTTLLDNAMQDKEIGKPIKIERIKDIPSGKKHPYHQFKVYTAKEGGGSD